MRAAITKTTAIIIAIVIIVAIALGAFIATQYAPAPAKKPQLVIYHWWTAGGEREGIDAAFSVFKQKYPDVEIVENPVAGGAGAVMKAVIWGLLAAGTPPDTFQVHLGGELVEYAAAGYLEPVDDIWKELGLDASVPSVLHAMAKYQGHYYAVPIGVHRSNVLMYNPKLFNELGIIEKFGDPASWNLTTLLNVARYIKAQRPDVSPIAMATRLKWPLTHLFEVLLALHGGPEVYAKFWTGQFNYKDPNDPVWKAVREVLNAIGIMVKEGLFNPNHPELEWDQAGALVSQGKAAMYIHGDWMVGWYVVNNLKYGEEWAAVGFPKNIFIVVVDSFNLCKNAPNPEVTKNWLRTIISPEAQMAFNPPKGSISPRIDVSPNYPDPYRPVTAQDFKTATLIPSAVHGGISKEAFVTEAHNILTSMITMITTGADIDTAVNYAVQSLMNAIETTGLPQFWDVSYESFITRR